MKINSFYTLFLVIITIFSATSVRAEDALSPYIKVGTKATSIESLVNEIKSALTGAQFEVLGDYSPENNARFHVIAYTRADLQQISLTKKDRGALAAILKVGLIDNNGVITISMLNPMYLFNAYFGSEITGKTDKLAGIADAAKSAMKAFGNSFAPFGGSVETDDLQDYKYMAFMPKFGDPSLLNEFASFEEGLQTIRKNLAAGKGSTKKVYELVFAEKGVAVFGVGLFDKAIGEAHFLPIIGEENIAAMPYEIILQGTKATMLPGKYRLAVHWPELSMGTFMKIVSTPGEIESTLEGLTK